MESQSTSNAFLESKRQDKLVADALISGYVILVDLADSTSLKAKHKDGPAQWIGVFINFYEMVIKNLKSPLKLLGDGMLYVFPDTSIPKVKNAYRDTDFANVNASPSELLKQCINLVNELEDQNAQISPKDQYFITITLDYGDGIYDTWSAEIGSTGSHDFLGTTIDRAFRINGITGKNCISISSEFFEKLDLRNNTEFCLEDFEKIHLSDKLLKGIDKPTQVYVYSKDYLKKGSLQNRRLLAEKELVEKEKVLGTKARLHLLKRIIRESQQ